MKAGDTVVLPDGTVGSVVKKTGDTVEVNVPKEGEPPDKPGAIRAWTEIETFLADDLEPYVEES